MAPYHLAILYQTMSKVTSLPASVNFTVMQALDSAKQMAESNELADVLILGYDTDGCLVIRSSKMDRQSALWIVEQAKLWVLDLE